MRLIALHICLIISFLTYSQDYSDYNEILKKYVKEDGMVDYKGLIKERDKFNTFLLELSDNPPKSSWSENRRKAYWINAYNAFTLKLIIDNYPVKSITDLHPFFYIPMFNTVWHEEFFQIGGEDFDLDRIEHDILRKEFNDPRIHFAINCASYSCPVLMNQAYTETNLERQLEQQTRLFINDPQRNHLDEDNPELSKIFSWFEDDFKEAGGVITFVNKYASMKISSEANVNFLPYNWSLNE